MPGDPPVEEPTPEPEPQPTPEPTPEPTTLVTSIPVETPTETSVITSPSPSPINKCPVVLDGRIPVGTAATVLDTNNKYFNPDYVKGNNLKWSDIIKLPSVPQSRFDAAVGAQALEVTISDKSIFMQQNGFRRAGLQFNGDSSDDASSKGVKTIHFSVRVDATRALNLTHEYLNVWHETADYSANQFNFQTGTIIGKSSSDRNNWKVLNRNNQLVWSTPMVADTWQNFAITLDFSKNTFQVYYSAGNDPLKSVTSSLSNNLAGNGQYQIGVLKKPTGTSDVVNSGYQQRNLNEGVIYGGLFVEDSAGGCVSL
ncbi:glycoside hydrolase family 131 protein [Patellaria atrata CBS 101060]|uniref:Glycoside hydrolase family 131 protein n=1 Tax=Patellaria atrata CBS 101060 TaxID=1346257 RepID=A0A9P4SG79_9PEZI|nr:glycoside hydrolase family 131 protein [Patellaria atrata CBS 101060]